MAAKYKVKTKTLQDGKYKHEIEVPIVYKLDFVKDPTSDEVDAAVAAKLVKDKIVKAKLVAYLEKHR